MFSAFLEPRSVNLKGSHVDQEEQGLSNALGLTLRVTSCSLETSGGQEYSSISENPCIPQRGMPTSLNQDDSRLLATHRQRHWGEGWRRVSWLPTQGSGMLFKGQTFSRGLFRFSVHTLA